MILLELAIGRAGLDLEIDIQRIARQTHRSRDQAESIGSSGFSGCLPPCLCLSIRRHSTGGTRLHGRAHSLSPLKAPLSLRKRNSEPDRDSGAIPERRHSSCSTLPTSFGPAVRRRCDIHRLPAAIGAAHAERLAFGTLSISVPAHARRLPARQRQPMHPDTCDQPPAPFTPSALASFLAGRGVVRLSRRHDARCLQDEPRHHRAPSVQQAENIGDIALAFFRVRVCIDE